MDTMEPAEGSGAPSTAMDGIATHGDAAGPERASIDSISFGEACNCSPFDAVVVADHVTQIWSKALLGATDATGALVLAVVFGGDEDLFLRRGRKSVSLLALSDELRSRGISLSQSKLRRMVHHHLLLRRLPHDRPVASLTHVTPSHLDEIVGRPRDDQVALLLNAEDQRRSVAQLRRLRRRTGGRESLDRCTGTDTLDWDAIVELERREDDLTAAVKLARQVHAPDRDVHLRLLGVAVRLRGLAEALERAARTTRPESMACLSTTAHGLASSRSLGRSRSTGTSLSASSSVN